MNGDRVKVYPSGAFLKGTVVDEIFQVNCVDVAIHGYLGVFCVEGENVS